VPSKPAPLGHVAVLDDDPTGVQTLGGVRVLLDWRDERAVRTAGRARSLHLLTNARAFPPVEARTLVRSAAAAVLSAAPNTRVVLRGDSTLRGHVLEEYLAVRDALGTAGYPPLVLVPALPSAGRVTVDGVQYLERDGARLPVHVTEYASDGVFAYSSSRLLEWAEERTRGLFPAAEGTEVHLATLREDGPGAVAAALTRAAAGGQATAVAVDSETADDVELVAEGLGRAAAAGLESIVRCGPALAGALGAATAREYVDVPAAARVLLVCGSYVPQSLRQLAAVAARFPDAVVAVDPAELATAAFDEPARALAARLDEGLAVLAVAGVRSAELSDLAGGLRVARGLAALLAKIDRPDALVLLKGGVTSAVGLREGLGAEAADIVGPVLPGVALWQILEPARRSALVIPGNVGGDDLLVDLLERALAKSG
jgi:uncharacterized protein YgbK (DUF1537 family)